MRIPRSGVRGASRGLEPGRGIDPGIGIRPERAQGGWLHQARLAPRAPRFRFRFPARGAFASRASHACLRPLPGSGLRRPVLSRPGRWHDTCDLTCEPRRRICRHTRWPRSPEDPGSAAATSNHAHARGTRAPAPPGEHQGHAACPPRLPVPACSWVGPSMAPRTERWGPRVPPTRHLPRPGARAPQP